MSFNIYNNLIFLCVHVLINRVFILWKFYILNCFVIKKCLLTNSLYLLISNVTLNISIMTNERINCQIKGYSIPLFNKLNHRKLKQCHLRLPTSLFLHVCRFPLLFIDFHQKLTIIVSFFYKKFQFSTV